ncbi:DUF2993 domain-containing protein [Frankia sp. AgB32]|uniref:LmeA family phospholipid-binding protein n=1 Tax=Frankia sp. AgB32 TaxID=631119 RepID=UPI00200D92CC|nr:DUF2993 domain-containing protein [Frankia sp. AgB32]MCK9894603.1 DUF2993 domain-containing protein [Frankia sp. AgB32]
MNDGRDGDEQTADGADMVPAEGDVTRLSDPRARGGAKGARPGAPAGPPPPADSFRPAGPPPPADSFRPGRPLGAAAGPPPPAAPPTGRTAQVPRRGAPAPDPAAGESSEGTMIIERGGAVTWDARSGAPAPGGPGVGGPGAGRPGVGAPLRKQSQPYPSNPAEPWPGTGQLPVNATPAASAGHGAASGPPGPTAPKPPRRRRRGRLLAIIAVVLVVLFVVGDRVGVVIAKGQMRKQVEASVAENLKPGDPKPTVTDVSIGGFPFLTQVLFGKYTDIGVGIDGIPTPGPKITSVKAHLKGLHVPLNEALTDSVGKVPVDEVRATVVITYADLNAYLAKQAGAVQVNPVDGGKRVEVLGTLDVPGFGSQQVGGVTTFAVTDNSLTLVPSGLKVAGVSIPLPTGVFPAIPIPVSGLPFHLKLVKASTNATGLSLTATAKDLVLPAK